MDCVKFDYGDFLFNGEPGSKKRRLGEKDPTSTPGLDVRYFDDLFSFYALD